MLQTFNVLDWWTKDETWESDADAVRGFVLCDVFPNSQFTEFLSGAVADVRVLCLTSIFDSDLKYLADALGFLRCDNPL